MEEKILETRFSHLHIADRRAGSSGGCDDGRNQRAAMIGVKVEVPVARRAHFRDAPQLTECRGETLRRCRELQPDDEAAGNRSLQLLR